jgi:hypothetical protein
MILKQKKIQLLDSQPANNKGNHYENRLRASADLKVLLWLLLVRYSKQNSLHEAIFEMYKQIKKLHHIR